MGRVSVREATLRKERMVVRGTALAGPRQAARRKVSRERLGGEK
jgi:hypothetical protein